MLNKWCERKGDDWEILLNLLRVVIVMINWFSVLLSVPPPSRCKSFNWHQSSDIQYFSWKMSSKLHWKCQCQAIIRTVSTARNQVISLNWMTLTLTPNNFKLFITWRRLPVIGVILSDYYYYLVRSQSHSRHTQSELKFMISISMETTQNSQILKLNLLNKHIPTGDVWVTNGNVRRENSTPVMSVLYCLHILNIFGFPLIAWLSVHSLL